jgi:predicted transcriptional regulator
MNAERNDIISDEDAAADARADADIKAGRGVPHEEVVAWLKKWGTLDEVPAPREWFE